jgi:hypothetical protein
MRLELASLPVVAMLAVACGSSGKAAPRNTMLGAADHSGRFFPIQLGDTHGPPVGQVDPECNRCHYDKAAAAPSASFRTYTCTNCHVLLRSGIYHDDPQATFSAWHVAAGVNQFDSTVAAANVVGVAPVDAACRSCHPSGIAVDHATRFLLPHQDAAATIVAKCADCHLDPANRLVLGCAQCHPHDLVATTTGHAKVPDFQATSSALCARCHEDGKIPVAVAAHAAGAGGFVVGSGLHSGTVGGACLTCHPQNKTTAPRTFVADFKVTTCVACHVTVGGTALHHDVPSLTTLHSTVVAFTSTVSTLGLSAACLSCHADGSGGLPANHPFPAGAGTRHAGIGCAQCHGTGLKTDLTALACASCHAALDPTIVSRHTNPGGIAILAVHTSQSTLGPALTMTSPNCLRCHADSQVDLVASHPAGDSGFGRAPHMAAGCVTCHAVARTDKPYPAINFGSATGCVTCHVNGVPN